MTATKFVKFHIERHTMKSGRILYMVVGTLNDGRNMCWGEPVTERGAQTVLKRAAKRNGFVVTGDTAQPEQAK